jgi:hypothetical protein
MMSSSSKIALGAFATWLIPLVVSFGLYNPETKIYLPNYFGFKFIMALLAAATAFLTMRWMSRHQVLTPTVPTAYVVVNSALDLLVLVAVLKMPSTFWATTVFPIYILVFGIIYLIVRR